MKKLKVRTRLFPDMYALIDDEDFARAGSLKWWVYPNGYIYTQFGRKAILLHRFIMDAPKGSELDHINGNKLDNRRVNLRFCTRSQNNANKPGASRYKGIRWTKNRWQAEIKKDSQPIYLGRFHTAEEAAYVYDQAAIQLFEDFAYLNLLGGVR